MKSYLATFLFMLLFLVSTITDSSAQLKWTKDPSNPILSGGALQTWNRHIFEPYVLYNTDSLRYEMWYTASGGAPDWRPNRIGYATSEDGLNWTRNDTAVLVPEPGTWEKTSVQAPMVLRENGQYRMWYTGWYEKDSAGIGYATSLDGITWTKDTLHNPVLGCGTAAWEAGGAGWCQVIPFGGEYKMWYVGVDVNRIPTGIGYATSVDGITWVRDTLHNPVLLKGEPGQWDDFYFLNPKVVFIDDKYYMLYMG